MSVVNSKFFATVLHAISQKAAASFHIENGIRQIARWCEEGNTMLSSYNTVNFLQIIYIICHKVQGHLWGWAIWFACSKFEAWSQMMNSMFIFTVLYATLCYIKT